MIPQTVTMPIIGGSFLFSTPLETGRWEDRLTHKTSASLGQGVYRTELAKAGFTTVGMLIDEGGSHD
ncbi:MAG: hypothetical protein AAGL90_02635 [Pseudomonadota bacterium]